MMNKRFLKVLNFTLCFILSFIVLSSKGVKQVRADEGRIGVVNSRIEGIKVKQGESTTFPITVVNNSTYTDIAGWDKNALFSYTTYISADDDITTNATENVDLIKESKWLTFDATTFVLPPNKQFKVNVVLTVPKDADIGEHFVVVKINRSLIEGVDYVGGNTFTSELRVPVYFTVTDEHGNYNAEPNFSLKDLDLKTDLFSLGEGEDSGFKVIVKDMASFVISSVTLNREKIVENYETLLNKPYKLEYKGVTYYDIKINNKTTLNNVVTDGKLSSKKYIYLPKEIDITKTVKNIKFNKDKVDFTLADDTQFTLTFNNADTVKNIQEQINNITNGLSMQPRLDWVLSKVIVDKNLKYPNSKLYFLVEIENTGNTLLAPKGNIVVNKNNMVVDTKDFQDVIIKSGEKRNLTAEIELNDTYVKGNYLINAGIKVLSNGSPNTYSFDFNLVEFRHYILIASYVLIGIIAIIIIMLIKLGVKKGYNRYKAKKLKVVHVSNTEADNKDKE
ncbi:hypothetical protein D3C81_10540 [compost metagenome]